jgi:hypothetical protein
VGLYPDFGVAHKFVNTTEAERPDPVAQACYAELYPLFLETYCALESIFIKLANQV